MGQEIRRPLVRKAKISPRTPNPGGKERRVIRAKNAFQLRCEGWTYQQIADRMGVALNTVFEDVDRIREEAKKHALASADREREEMLGQCKEMIARLAPFVLDDEVDVRTIKNTSKGVVVVSVEKYDAMIKASAAIVKVQERIAKLTGIDAPERVQADVTSRVATDDELLAREQEAAPLVSSLGALVDRARARRIEALPDPVADAA